MKKIKSESGEEFKKTLVEKAKANGPQTPDEHLEALAEALRKGKLKQRIQEALEGVYGKSFYCPVVAEQLAEKIPEWEAEGKKARRSTQEEVRLCIWNCFAGGDTAEVAAKRVLEAIA